IVLLISATVHPPVLHSFPTRRSSDLPRVARVARIGGDHQLDPRLFARALYDAVRSRGARHIKDSVDAISVHSLSAHCDADASPRSEEHTSELQSRFDLVCRLLLEKKY